MASTIWIGLLKHIMQAKQGQYIPKFPPNRKWISAFSTSTGQNLTTEQQHGNKWARTAISQLWKVTAQSARTARNEELHREKNADISESAQNERIRRIYMLEGEISTRGDKHFFGTELEILLKSRMSKKRRFLAGKSRLPSGCIDNFRGNRPNNTKNIFSLNNTSRAKQPWNSPEAPRR